jgi:hypothetical protein
VDQQIGPRNEAQEIFPLAAQIKSHSAFVRVEVKKEPTFLRIDCSVGERPTQTRWIAARVFDFDDIRAEIGHHFGRVCGRHHGAQL